MIGNIEKIIENLEKGLVIGVPTDTVYGFATLEQNSAKIYDLKQRNKNKKLISFIHDWHQIGQVDEFTNDELKNITEKYWPGNNTLIFKQKGSLVSYRIPQENNTLRLLKKINKPLVTTSANLSGEPPILTKMDFLSKFEHIMLLEEKIETKKTGIPSNIYIISKNSSKKIR